MQKAITKCKVEEFIPIDEWQPRDESEEIFKHVKGAIVLPVSKFYKLNEQNSFLDYFLLSSKRCYNGDGIRNHICQYFNYFEKYYDPEKELLMVYYKIKYLIDCQDKNVYTDDAFLYDLKKYILDSMIFFKVRLMNDRNYILNLDQKRSNVDKIKTPSLQYTDKHGKILMEMSVLMNMFIPLVAHYMCSRKILQVKDFLLKAFDMIFTKYEDDVDIYSKLYETSISSINKNADAHSVLWSMQNIRAKNTTTHSVSAVNDIILQIMPKYNYNQNIVTFNYISIQWNIQYQVTGIRYEYAFISLSSSKRDDDNNSEFDKFESHLVKQDESLFLQNKVNCEQTMSDIDVLFGPFDDDEIDYYIERLTNDNKFVINSFQKDLVFNLFYKYFGDPVSIKAINSRDYVKLIIAAKRMLEANNLVVLPYILSSKITRLMTRKNVNKKELMKLKNSQSYQYIQDKYKNEKIENHILSMIAGILSSEFEIIDFNNDEIDAKPISSLGDYLIEEMLTYISLI